MFQPTQSPNASAKPEFTGRYLVKVREDAEINAISKSSKKASLNLLSTKDIDDATTSVSEVLESEDGVYFDMLGLAVVKAEPSQMGILTTKDNESNPFLSYEPERYVYALGDESFLTPSFGLSAEYFRGYRDAVNQLFEKAYKPTSNGTLSEIAEAIAAASSTWGLQLTNAINSKYSGLGVNVAVLDTGFYMSHPDFAGRNVVAQSFVQGQSADDEHGHGTHCIGTALGPKFPQTGSRYGIAHEANIYVGKVLGNDGSGTDSSILQGIQWAIKNKCRIISMSLGAPVRVGESFSPNYEQVGKIALKNNTLIIAAAGNESRRPGVISPVGRPANSPSILAVAAIDNQSRIAPFSCGGLNPQGGQVDISGPGVGIYSSWITPNLFRTIDGTSMATPHVAGIAALLAQANPDASARGIWALLSQNALRLSLPSRDVGMGMVHILE